LINNTRTAAPTDHASLCLTNQEMRQQYIINSLAETKTDSLAQFACIGAPDDSGYPNLCQCAACTALAIAPNPPAELLTQFGNEVAAAYAKERPDIRILLLAYHHYRKPPVTTKPADNIVIQLCSIENSCSMPVSHERNRTFREDMLGWLKISKSVYIYNYIINFDCEFTPHPNLRALGADMKFFADHGVKGVFSEGGINGRFGATSLLEIDALRSWMLAKLMWNPTLNPQDLVEDFANGYYGPAAKYVLDYIDLIHNAVEASGDWLHLSSPFDAKFLTIDTLNAAWQHLQAAQASVKHDNVLSARVQCLQLSVLYPIIVRWQELKYAAMCRGIAWPMGESVQAVYDNFMKITAENNIRITGKSQEELAKAVKE